MAYIDKRYRRSTTETAYLTTEVLARSNLKVITEASVTKIIFDGTKKACGVEFARDANGEVFRALARKEVVVS